MCLVRRTRLRLLCPLVGRYRSFTKTAFPVEVNGCAPMLGVGPLSDQPVKAGIGPIFGPGNIMVFDRIPMNVIGVSLEI